MVYSACERSAELEKNDALIVDVEVDVVATLVGDDGGEALADDAVPVGTKSQPKY
jgi:hypothetical protein